jgi:hypothetical protein
MQILFMAPTLESLKLVQGILCDIFMTQHPHSCGNGFNGSWLGWGVGDFVLCGETLVLSFGLWVSSFSISGVYKESLLWISGMIFSSW